MSRGKSLDKDNISDLELPEFEIPVGEVVDRLIIVNIKMWHTDEGISRAKDSKDAETAGRLAWLARDLNRVRADLREELNRRLEGRTDGTNKIEYVGVVKGR